ncbi:hypothetical protein [Hugenholtzia roseola]|uniref:hypothetical protein n=1 Tax=Hugenholtzia roseola TaxID=1002 RepID=UPI001376B886|nr:hypothetical protein [Hugenholtzia roseola]
MTLLFVGTRQILSLMTRAAESYVFSTVPLIVMGVGISIFPTAFMPLNGYRRKIKIATEKKQNLDKLKQLYNFHYNISIKFKTDIFGNDKVEIVLKIER